MEVYLPPLICDIKLIHLKMQNQKYSYRMYHAKNGEF